MRRWFHFVCIVLGQYCFIATAPNGAFGQSTARSVYSNSDTSHILKLITEGNTLLGNANSNPSKALQLGQKADSLAAIQPFLRGKAESQVLIANAQSELNRWKEAIPCLEQAEDIFKKLQNTDGLIKTYRLRATIVPLLDQRALYYDKALTLMKAGPYKREVPALLAEASEVKMMQAQLPVAEEMLKESIQLSKELGIGQVHWQYSLLGTIQKEKRDYVEALKDQLLAIKIGEAYHDTSARMAEIYNFTGLVYTRMGKLDDATIYFQKAMATAATSREPGLTVQLYSNMAGILIRQNKPRDALQSLVILEKNYAGILPLNAKIQLFSRLVRCYTTLHELEKAGPYAEQLISWSNSLKPDEYDQLAIYNELNGYLIASHQYEKARSFVEQQKKTAEKFKAFEQLNQTYYFRFKIDSAAGNMASALSNFQMYTRGKDSVYNENTANKLNQLHVEFETEKKDKELKLKEQNIKLLVQETILQKALSEKRAQELAINNQALELKQKDLIAEKQQIQLLTKQTELQEAEGEKQKQNLVIQQKNIELLKQSNKLQESDLRQTRIMRNVIIVGTILLALISLLIYSRYRMKKRASDILEQQREEIRLKNFSLQALLKDKDKLLIEKEWLVKEVHHRVKNNLQMVMSLLNSQSVYLSNEDALSAIKESQRRMQAIALIHQKLYEKDEATINMHTYILQLIDYLKDSFNCRHIRFTLHIQPIELEVTRAVPVALILNEAITNSLKYAFPHDKPGNLTVTFEKIAPCFELTIQDNGIGLPPDFSQKQQDSLGMSLMEGLALQLKGKCEITGRDGVKVFVAFNTEDTNATLLNNNLMNAGVEN